MNEGTLPPPEFSRVASIARLTGTARHRLAANAEERARLARRFGLVELPRFEADVELCRLAGGRIRLHAVLHADVVQSCVVTLEPVAGTVEDEFTLIFASDAPEAIEDVLVSGDEEVVEPLVGDAIDIGEAVAQELSLALDPFPRAADAAPLADVPEAEEIKESPFAALAKLRRPKDQ
jgi:uncharacterized metal-binding protein YceD (DUF177 family)